MSDLRVKPNKWTQFADPQLRELVTKNYPQMRNTAAFPRHTLIELLEQIAKG